MLVSIQQGAPQGEVKCNKYSIDTSLENTTQFIWGYTKYDQMLNYLLKKIQNVCLNPFDKLWWAL